MNENNVTQNVEQNVETQNNMEQIPTNNVPTETVVETPVTEPMITVPLETKKKKGGPLKGFIIFLIVVLIIGGLIFGGIKLYKHLTYVEDPFPDIDTLGTNPEDNVPVSLSNQLYNDYLNGTINTDQYIMQLAYALFEHDKLDPKYNDAKIDFSNINYFFNLAAQKGDELSDDTKKYILGKYLLDYAQWDVDEDKTSSTDYKVEKVIYDYYIYKLSKAVLSKNGHFLVYYTTEGDNAVTDKRAKEYADALEDAITAYKKEFGLEYQYDDLVLGDIVGTDIYKGTALGFATAILTKENIDLKYIHTAMPVYVTNIDMGNAEAAYTPYQGAYFEWLNSMYGAGIQDMLVHFWEGEPLNISSYSVPYIVINAQIDNTEDVKLIAKHELFHHYQSYICGDGKYVADCGTLFIKESTANLAAINASNKNQTGTAINGWAVIYDMESEKSIEKVGSRFGDAGLGYGAYVFAYNYATIVDNGYHKIFNAMKSYEPLRYLYDNSGGKYKQVMLTLAEKNLTQDYSNSLLKSIYATNVNLKHDGDQYYPIGSELSNNFFGDRVNIDYSSMKYYYVDPSDLSDEATIEFSGGLTNPENTTLLVFVKENGKYKKIYSQDLTKKVVLKAVDWTAYDELAFAVVETSINDTGVFFNVSVTNTSKEKATITPESLGLKKPKTKSGRKDKYDNAIMCYQVEDTDYFKTGYQVLINLDKDQNIDNMLMKGTLKVKDNVIATKAFDAAKKVAPGIILGIKLRYKQMLKNVRITTTETDDSWTILFKVTKDYDGAFTSSFGPAGNSKEEIINTIKAKGFICE